MSEVHEDVARFLSVVGNCDYAVEGRRLPVARRRGARIRQLRKAQGINQPDLAQRVGITPGYLSEVEIGKRLASEALYRQIAAVLGTTLEELEVEP